MKGLFLLLLLFCTCFYSGFSQKKQPLDRSAELLPRKNKATDFLCSECRNDFQHIVADSIDDPFNYTLTPDVEAIHVDEEFKLYLSGTGIKNIYPVISVEFYFPFLIQTTTGATDEVKFYNDGTHGDKIANDTIFTAANIALYKPFLLDDSEFGRFKKMDLAFFGLMGFTVYSRARYDNGIPITYEHWGRNLNLKVIDYNTLKMPKITKLNDKIQLTSHIINIVASFKNDTYVFGNDNPYAKIYYQYFEDDRDFLYIYRKLNTSGCGLGGAYEIYNYDIEGLGLPKFKPWDFNNINNLKGIINVYMDFRAPYIIFNHEILHHWAANLKDPMTSAPDGHWNGMIMKNSGFGSPSFKSLKKISEGKYEVELNNIEPSEYLYNPLELYAMGLGSIDEIEFPLKRFGSATSIQYNDNNTATIYSNDLRELSKEEFIKYNGLRVPDVIKAQKEFKTAMILVSEEPMTEAEMTLHHHWAIKAEETELPDKFIQNFWINFNVATQNKGRIITKLPEQFRKSVNAIAPQTICNKEINVYFEAINTEGPYEVILSRSDHNSEYNLGKIDKPNTKLKLPEELEDGYRYILKVSPKDTSNVRVISSDPFAVDKAPEIMFSAYSEAAFELASEPTKDMPDTKRLKAKKGDTVHISLSHAHGGDAPYMVTLADGKQINVSPPFNTSFPIYPTKTEIFTLASVRNACGTGKVLNNLSIEIVPFINTVKWDKNSICSDSSYTVNFITDTDSVKANYIVQLSDIYGNFSNNVKMIGQGNKSPIVAKIPYVPYSESYKIRVMIDNDASLAQPTDAFSVSQAPYAEIRTTEAVLFSDSTAKLKVTLHGTPPWEFELNTGLVKKTDRPENIVEVKKINDFVYKVNYVKNQCGVNYDNSPTKLSIITSNTETEKQGKRIHVFPVPTENISRVEISDRSVKEINYSITSADGKILKTKVAEKTHDGYVDINFEDYPSGTYTLTVFLKEQKITTKIIKY